jgi:hypothetical protein
VAKRVVRYACCPITAGSTFPRMPDSSPVLVTEQLVMFDTTGTRPRLTRITYRVIGTIGVLAAAFRPPIYCAHRSW